jgi:pimeloyl-ACP methyl ester carboxylesterase
MVKLFLAATLMAVAQPNAVELTAKGPEGPLAGTLVDAGKKAPLIVVLPGSGPTDRDGNNPLGVTAASYRLLAESLAQKGVSSLRIDKRGMFGSKAAGDPNRVTISGYAKDTNAWLDALQTRYPKAKCFWLLGHSEGGLVAMAAARDNKRVCGVVLVASPGRKLSDVMREQFRANPANAPILADALRAIDELEARRRVDNSAMHPALQGIFNPAVQDFLIDLFNTDPAALAANVEQSLLIVQGGRDGQVMKSDSDRLGAAQPKARSIWIEEMTHTLKAAADSSQAANLETYSDPSKPIVPTLVDEVVAFVAGQKH